LAEGMRAAGVVWAAEAEEAQRAALEHVWGDGSLQVATNGAAAQIVGGRAVAQLSEALARVNQALLEAERAEEARHKVAEEVEEARVRRVAAEEEAKAARKKRLAPLFALRESNKSSVLALTDAEVEAWRGLVREQDPSVLDIPAGIMPEDLLEKI